MNEKTEKKLADGFFWNKAREGAPDFVRGGISVQVDRAVAFLQANANEKGYVNLDLLRSKDGTKNTFFLNDWKPEVKKDDFGDPLNTI